MKVVMCWGGISGYLAACWRALAARPEIELHLVLFPGEHDVNAPFRTDILNGLSVRVCSAADMTDARAVAEIVAAYQPEVVVVPGWWIPACAALPFAPALRDAKFVMAMDTPRKYSLRQWLGRIKLRRLLARIDRIMVPGERSWQYARFLGFEESQIRRGMYGFDGDRLEPVHARRQARPGGWPRRFLFVGRYMREKAIDVLMEAYASYRTQVPDPWPLTCCGRGPMQPLLQSADGVSDRGFVQPADQPALFEEHGVFVLASRFDPWPLVILEACAAGLPIVCTEACGSSVELVRSDYNGKTVATDDAADLARGLLWAHRSFDQLSTMGQRARAAAAAYAAPIWAQRWIDMLGGLVPPGTERKCLSESQ